MSKAKTETTALATQETAQLPAFLTPSETPRGAESIGRDDVQLQALRLAQSMSPEVKRADPAYVEGLREGDLFNNVTRQNYGDNLDVVIVSALGHRHIEFAPLNDGGGVVDFNVPDGDPRTEFTTKTVDGKETRVKPVATKFYDYLILALLPEGPKLMTLSFKGTSIKTATRLNALLKELSGKGLDTFAQQFTVRTVPDKRGVYNFFNWRVDPAGWVSEAVYHAAAKVYAQFADKDVAAKIQRVQEREEETNDFA